MSFVNAIYSIGDDRFNKHNLMQPSLPTNYLLEIDHISWEPTVQASVYHQDKQVMLVVYIDGF